MQHMRFVQVSIAGTAFAIALFAADFWKTKDSTQWTSEEVNKMLTNSPWAGEQTVAPQAGQGQGPRQRRGGFGIPGGGYPGGGYPGGGYPGGGYPGGGYPGGGYPGGGYPRGGGGYPGGGYPGGGGYPSGGGYPDDNGNGGGRIEPMNVTIRWESAAPVQQALMRQRSLAEDESKKLADLSQKDYVIALLGFRMPAQGRNRYGDSDDQSAPDNDRDRNNTGNDRLRSQLLEAAQLTPKGGHTVYPEDVQFEGPRGSETIRLLFPRTTAISAGDKEVDFLLQMRGVKLEHKFRLSDMQYEGKLAL